jgi:hypothetical protein
MNLLKKPNFTITNMLIKNYRTDPQKLMLKNLDKPHLVDRNTIN